MGACSVERNQKIALFFFVLFAFVLQYNLVHARLIDDFEDANLSSDTNWNYDTDCVSTSTVQDINVINGRYAWKNTHNAGTCNAVLYTIIDTNTVTSFLMLGSSGARIDLGFGKNSGSIASGTFDFNAYAVLRTGTAFTLVANNSVVTGSTSTPENTWFKVTVDMNGNGVRGRIFDASGNLLETLNRSAVGKMDKNVVFLATQSSPGAGQEYADLVTTRAKDQNITLDINSPTDGNFYLSNLINLKLILRDPASVCPSYNVDLNNNTGQDRNVLFRGVVTDAVTQDVNFNYIPKKDIFDRTQLRVSATCTNSSLTQQEDFNFSLNLYDINALLTNYGTFDSNNFINDLNVQVNYRCSLPPYDTNYYYIGKELLGASTDINKLSFSLSCNNTINTFSYRYSHPVASKYNFKSWFNPIYPTDQNQYFDFNGYQGRAFDDNRFWSVSNDANGALFDPNTFTGFNGLGSIRIDVNKFTSSGNINALADYNPSGVWDLTDWNSSELAGWVCISNKPALGTNSSTGSDGVVRDWNFAVELSDGTVAFRKVFKNSEIPNICNRLEIDLNSTNHTTGGRPNWANITRVRFLIGSAGAGGDFNLFSVWLDGWKIVKGDQRSDINFFVDTTPPTITLFDYSSTLGWSPDANGSIRLQCADSTGNSLYDYNSVRYKIQNNDVNLFTGDLNKNTIKAPDSNFFDGLNQIYVECRDLAYNIDSDTNSANIRVKKFALVNEQTGLDFNVLSVSGLVARSYATNQTFDFKANNKSNRYFLSSANDTIRFDANYFDGTPIFREFNLDLLFDVNTVPVCMATLQTFYQILLSSAQPRGVRVVNSQTNCFSMADYTKYAYQGSLINTVYAINAPYYMYSVDIAKQTTSLLALIDGTKVNTINLDIVIFNGESSSFPIDGEGIATRQTGTSTMQIYYSNIKGDNNSVSFTIYDGDVNIFTFSNSTTPNSVFITFDYSTLGSIDSNSLKIVATSIKQDGSTKTFTQFFFPGVPTVGVNATNSGTIFIILGLFIFVMAVSIVAAKFAFGWFGLFAGAFALMIFGFAANVWYVQLISGVILVSIAYMAFVYKDEYLGVT